MTDRQVPGPPGSPPAYPPPGAAYPPPGAAYPPPGAAYPPPGAAYPPPGAAYPPPGRTAPGPSGPPGWTPPPLLAAAHKPGAIPLRPLGLGDLYDGAFRIIRFNPRATVGSAVLVAAVAMALPVLVTAALTWTVDLSMDSSDAGDTDVAGLIGSFGALGLGTLLQGLGMILVTGMVAHVASAAAVGRRLSLGEAWAATRGRRWRLVGLAFLLGALLTVAIVLYVLAWVGVALAGAGAVGYAVFGLVTVPLFLTFLAWFWVRVYYLPVPALMLEEVGILGAVDRGFALTRGHFWRTFGIGLLTALVTGVASYALTMPLAFLGPLVAVAAGPEYAVLGLVVVQAVSSVLSAAFVTPFTSTVTALQYVDLRMRKEGYDVELLARAGITPS